MIKFKISVLSLICCCSKEDDSMTPQPTINLESKRSINNVHYEKNDVNNSLKLEVLIIIFYLIYISF